MFLALGVGAFAAGVFHVFTHSFFKALLFLGAGSVIHAMSGEQDMRNMGALAGKIPTTFRTMFIATWAITGLPLMAGFFSKDEILWQAFRKSPYLWAIGFVTALMTAFYMFRLIYLTFWSPSRMTSLEVEHHIHESPKSMTGPLVILAALSITAGYLNWPSNVFERFLEPVFANTTVAAESAPATEGGSRGTELGLMGLSVLVAFGGWFLASRYYKNAGKDYEEPIAAAAPPVYSVLLNKYYVDEGYDYVFTGRRKLGDVRLGAMGAGEASSWFDANVVDGAVNGAGWITRLTATLSRWWDTWIIDGIGVNGPAILARLLSYPARLFEWGLVQWYALVMTAGLVGMAFYYVYR
jgi:NADH-quinone oxidoreductase subunit L